MSCRASRLMPCQGRCWLSESAGSTEKLVIDFSKDHTDCRFNLPIARKSRNTLILKFDVYHNTPSPWWQAAQAHDRIKPKLRFRFVYNNRVWCRWIPTEEGTNIRSTPLHPTCWLRTVLSQNCPICWNRCIELRSLAETLKDSET